MTTRLAARIARRELRGGLKGFRIFLLCLALGVAAIAAVGTLRAAIQSGLEDQGAALLGGDAQMEFTYRFADAEELAFMDRTATRRSEVVDFRSMAVIADDSALTQIKAVDANYPLYGTVTLDPPIPLADALATKGGLPGAALDPVLIARLSLNIGDTFTLGTQTFRLTAAVIREPDSSGGFTLGPRTIIRTDALAASGLLAPGSLYETEYRLALPPGTNLQQLEDQAKATFREKGMSWSDSRRAAPGIDEFVDRIGSFLVLVGLAGLAVGGVGISAAVRAYLDGKIATIATLKTIGAEGRLIFRIYLFQILVLAGIGIVAGLILGAGIPMLFSPMPSYVPPPPIPMPEVPRPPEPPESPMSLLKNAPSALRASAPSARSRPQAAVGAEGSPPWAVVLRSPTMPNVLASATRSPRVFSSIGSLLSRGPSLPHLRFAAALFSFLPIAPFASFACAPTLELPPSEGSSFLGCSCSES